MIAREVGQWTPYVLAAYYFSAGLALGMLLRVAIFRRHLRMYPIRWKLIAYTFIPSLALASLRMGQYTVFYRSWPFDDLFFLIWTAIFFCGFWIGLRPSEVETL